MADGPFKSMGRDPDSERCINWYPRVIGGDVAYRPRSGTWCTSCNSWVEIGDWPFCAGKPEDHER